MKYSILKLVLGVSVALGIPSLALADKPHKNRHVDKHVSKQVKKQFGKERHHNKNRHRSHVRKDVKRHVHKNRHRADDRRHVYKHKHKNKYRSKDRRRDTQFSITWSSGIPELIIDHGYSHNKYKKRHRNDYARVREINRRLDNQHRRIRKGVDSGQLVRREARSLRHEQRRISNRFADYRSDGWLNRHETRRLNRMLDVASQEIRRKKHNSLTRHSIRHNRDRYDYAWH